MRRSIGLILAFAGGAMGICVVALSRDAASVPVDEPKALCEKVMAAIHRGKVAEGLGSLEPYCLFSKTDFAVMKIRIANEMAQGRTKYGEVIGTELVKLETIGNWLSRYTYAIKLRKTVVRATFTFYKPGEQLFLQELSFDDEVDEMLRDLAVTKTRGL